MIFYLNNRNKFHLYFNSQEVIFILYEEAIEGPMKTSTRWVNKNMFKSGHMTTVVELLKSKHQGDRNIGLQMLEQTLKTSINGEVEGHIENV